MSFCKSCGAQLERFDVSYPYPDDMRKRECPACHDYSMETGALTQCDTCGAYFPGSHLKRNKETGQQELCPSCGCVCCD
jgi:NAD-dependent SIR2 family protein deacetylase